MSILTLAVTATLLQNAGFEVGTATEATAWGAARDPFSFVIGEGRNGTKALFFDVKKDSPYAFPSQEVPLEPGQKYLVEGWIRTDGLVGAGAGASLELGWRKKDGTWIGARYSAGLRGTTAGYERVKLIADVPAEAGICTLSPFVAKGGVGRAWFDDLSIRPYEGPALGALVTDAYRNIAVRGPVTLSAVVLMRPETQARRGVQGTFILTGTDGQPFSLAAKIDGAYARATVDVARLPMGESAIRFRLTDAGGKTLGESKAAFRRVEKMPDWPVRIDGGRTLVDGRPFYPIGVFLSRITRKALGEIREGAFNCVLPYSSPTKEEMDLAREMGFKVIYSIKDAFYGTRACVPAISSPETELAWVRERIRTFKDHPALLAWYINDELGVEIRDRLIARRELVTSLDPGHPTYVALYQTEDFPAYVGTFDVFGGDPYPICQTGNPPISQVTEHTRLARAAACGGAMWQIPQLFDWGAYRKKDAPLTRPPTFDEFRNMAWQFVVEGAMGLVPYAHHSIHEMEARDPFAVQWQKICAVSHEIAAYRSVFVSAEPAPKVTQVPDGVGVRAWHANGRDYVLCVNTTRRTVTSVIDVAGHGAVPLELAPVGVEMKELRKGACRGAESDGRAELPILGWYGIPFEKVTAARYRQARDAGFTHMMQWAPDLAGSLKVLDCAREAGLRLLLHSPCIEGERPEEAVRALKSHPGLGLYHLTDEPAAAKLHALGVRAKRIMAEDPSHPCYLNWCGVVGKNPMTWYGTPDYRSYIAVSRREVPTQMISFDKYPVIADAAKAGPIPFRRTADTCLKTNWYETLEIVRDVSRREKVPFWAFALSTSHRIPGNAYFPTGHAYPSATVGGLKLQQYSNLAYGAQGLQYFTYWGFKKHDLNFHDAPTTFDGKETFVMDRLRRVNAELQARAHVFVGAEARDVWHAGPSLPSCTRPLPKEGLPRGVLSLDCDGHAIVSHLVNGGASYLMVVGGELHRDVTMKIRLADGVRRVRADGRTVPAADHDEEYVLSTGDAEIFRL